MTKDLLALAMPHGQFWNVLPSFANAAILDIRAKDYDAHLAAYQARTAVPTPVRGSVDPSDRPYKIASANGSNVALINIDGAMTRKPTSYGGTSTLIVQHAIRLAGRDDGVDAVLIVASSPGGSVNGLQELTDEIAAVAAIKPVDGFIPDGAYSAAYYALTAVRTLSIAETAQVGSLGTMMVLVNSKKAADDAGEEIEVISTGDLKGQGTPGTEPSDEYRQMLRDHAEAYGDFFWKAIEKGRPNVAARKDVFTGRYWMAADALALGLVDRIGSLDDAMESLVEATATEDDDQDHDPLARMRNAAAEAIAERRALKALAKGTTAVEPPAPAPAKKADPVSAPGGEDRPSAGNRQAPTSGAENQPDLGFRTMSNPIAYKTDLIRALNQRGMSAMATALNTDPSEDAYGVVNALVNSMDAELRVRESQNSLLLECENQGLKTSNDLHKLSSMAKIGAEAKANLQEKLYEASVQAFGADEAGHMKDIQSSLSFGGLQTQLEKMNALTDEKFGITAKEGATRKTAPNAVAPIATDANVETNVRAWDGLDEATKTQATQMGIVTVEAQDAFAKTRQGVK